MKIKIQQQKLAKALNYTSKAVSNKPNIPVLSNVLLEVSKDNLHLAATNLDMGISMWVGGVTEKDGRVTASGKFLADFIAAAGGERVDISLDGEQLVAQAERAQAKFHTIPATEFPVLPKVEGKPLFSMPTNDFIAAMDKVLFACATDITTSKIQFTGVLFELDAESPSEIIFVGLNGYRLSKKTAEITREGTEGMQLIVPAKPLQELVKIAAAEDEETVSVYLSSSKSQIIFQLGDIELSIRLLEGPYPDYKGVIPGDHSFSFEVDHGSFEHALRVVNTFARTTMGNKVNWDLDLEQGSLLMHSEVTDLGSNRTDLKVQNATGASDLKDAYSLQFLMEMINHMQSDVIQFKTKATLAPAVFTEKGDKSFLHIIMPVQRED